MNRKVWIGGVIVLSVALLLWANIRKMEGQPGSATTVQAKAKQGPSGAPLVKVATMKARPLTQEVVAPGQVEASQVRQVRAPFTAKQAALRVGLGERVQQGQLLLELDSSELSAQVLMQEAQVARAEAALAALRQEEQQAPVLLAQRLEQARAQLIQAEEALGAASRQTQSLAQRVEQGRTALELLQSRSAAGSDRVRQARDALVKAEEGYRANPLAPGMREAYEQARSAYEAALRQSQEEGRQAAAELGRTYDELKSAEEELQRSGGEDPAAVQLARSQVESARLSVRLAEMAAESGGTTAAQLAAAETDVAAVRASLAALRAKLAEARLLAPAGGTVLALGTKDGQPVQEGQLVLTIGDLEQMTVTARIDEVDIGKVKVGQVLSVRANAHPQNRLPGTVVRVAAQTSQTPQGAGAFFEVEGKVSNADGLLRSGMNGEVTISTEKRESTLVVGLAAVREEGDSAQVLVVEGFRVHLRPVKLGLRTQTEAEVLDGLKEGEQVVISPFTQVTSLKEGDSVRVEPAEGEGK